MASTQASAVIISDEYQSRCPVQTLVCEDPYLAFAKTVRLLNPPAVVVPGIHNTAIIAESSKVDVTARIEANVSIGENTTISAGAHIGVGTVIGDDVVIGSGSRLMANVTVYQGVSIGAECLVHSGSVLGADGFGIVKEDGQWLKIPQVGAVRIEDHVEIGANTTIDRGALTDTVIETGVKIDNQVQIGHGSSIGAHTAIAGCVAIAGSARIGKRCMIGGMSAISGHIEVTDDVTITGMSGVSNSIKKPGVYSAGIPVTENALWLRNITRFKNLDKLSRRLIDLENKQKKD